jgi:hypothetical protein
VKERFRAYGVECIQAAKPKSDLYRDLLPILNSGGVELLDHAKAVAQICNLERRIARGGRDSIDHAPSAHDDLANAIAGAVIGAAISQGGAEGWIAYYKNLSEQAGLGFSRNGVDMDDFRAAGPQFGWNLSSEPLHRVFLPPALVRGTPDVRWIENRPYVPATRNEAKEHLRHPAWRALNIELARELGIEEEEA